MIRQSGEDPNVLKGNTGERGPAGDVGQKGETGQEGKVGERGQASTERGPKGDHGQDGQRGETGRQGLDGLSATRRLVIIFIFITLCFSLLGFQVQKNTNTIDFNQKTQTFNSCERSITTRKSINALVSALADVEIRGTKPNSPSYDKNATLTRLERSKIYREAELPLPICSRPKR